MSTAWIALPLTEQEILHGKIPGLYPHRECAVCATTSDAYEFFDAYKKPQEYESVHHLPTVGVIYQVKLDGAELTESFVTSTKELDGSTLINPSVYIGADRLHNALHMPCSLSSHTDIGVVQNCIMNRAAANADYNVWSIINISGLQDWYRVIAAADPESMSPQIAGAIHVPVYLNEIRDINQNANIGYISYIQLAAARINAATKLSEHENPYVAQEFTRIAEIAKDVMREDAIKYLNAFNAQEYIAKFMENLHLDIQQEFLQKFAEEFDNTPHSVPYEQAVMQAINHVATEMYRRPIQSHLTDEQRQTRGALDFIKTRTSEDLKNITAIKEHFPEAFNKEEHSIDD